MFFLIFLTALRLGKDEIKVCASSPAARGRHPRPCHHQHHLDPVTGTENEPNISHY